ncbi:MAG: hypothetical protein FWH57_06875 [Oscillospiraceae bacterium]|nr:hypothetical protein [Oscillospiraceae bacterium]
MNKVILMICICFLTQFVLSACATSSDSQNQSLPNEEPSSFSQRALTEGIDNARIIEETEFFKLVWSDYLFYYYIYDNNHTVVKSEGPLSRQPRISIVDDLVKFTLQSGTGLGTQWGYFYDTKRDVFSEILYCIHDQFNGKVALVKSDKVIIRDIFSESKYYQEITTFNEPFSKMIDPIDSVSFIDDGESIEVIYFTGDNYQEVTEIFKLD